MEHLSLAWKFSSMSSQIYTHLTIMPILQTKKYADVIIPRGSDNTGREYKNVTCIAIDSKT